MMLEATTRIYVRDPQQADNLVPAVVSEVLDQKVMVRFLQPVSFKPGVETVVSFHDASNSFTSIPCQMQRMFSKGQYPTGALVLHGEPEVAESRNAFRFDILDQCVTAAIEALHEGEVVNISCGGIALLTDTGSYKQDQWLGVSLRYGGDTFNGKMQVRAKQQGKDGRFRYGMMVDPSDASMVSQLTRITQELQEAKATGTPGAGINHKAKTPAAPTSKAANRSATTAASPKPTTPQGTQRQHQRNPWPGMAKVYIREAQNIRVLSVDTEDLSRGGISFLSPQYIYEGSEVLFEKPITGGFFRVMVTVRNVRAQDGKTHRIGAQFLGAPMEPGMLPKGFDAVAQAA